VGSGKWEVGSWEWEVGSWKREMGSGKLSVSCGSDEAAANLELFIGETEVGGLVVNGYVITGYQSGSEPLRSDVEGTGYSRTTFVLTDGEYVFDDNGNITDFIGTDTDLWIEIELMQEGEVDFEAGEYTLLNDCAGPYSNDNTAEVYAWWYTNPAESQYVYYYEDSGFIKVNKSGNTYSFTVDGQLIAYQDYNAPARQEGGNCDYYGRLDITGKFKGSFTEIPYEKWD